MKHYVVSAATKAIKTVDQEPAWASTYWAWKSGQASPADPAFKIAVDERHETKRSTSAPTGGALAKGGGGQPSGALADAINSTFGPNTLVSFKVYTDEITAPG